MLHCNVLSRLRAAAHITSNARDSNLELNETAKVTDQSELGMMSGDLIVNKSRKQIQLFM